MSCVCSPTALSQERFELLTTVTVVYNINVSPISSVQCRVYFILHFRDIAQRVPFTDASNTDHVVVSIAFTIDISVGYRLSLVYLKTKYQICIWHCSDFFVFWHSNYPTLLTYF